MPRDLKNLRFTRVALVDKGANFDKATKDGAHILLWKRHVEKGPNLSQVHVDSVDCPCSNCDQRDDYEKSVMTSGTRNALPDSSFAAVWTDASGQKQRKLPYRHADGSLDQTHWANAQARIEGSQMPEHVKATARHKLEAARPKEKRMKLTDLLKRAVGISAEPDVAKRQAALDAFTKALDTPGSPEYEAADGTPIPQIHPDHVAAMKAHRDQLATMIKAYGDGPHPDGHPVNDMKAMHEKMCKALAVHESPGSQIVKEGDMNADVMKAEISKATTDLEKRLKESEESNKETVKLLKAERTIRLQGEMVSVLKSFKATPFNIDLADEKNDVSRFLKMQEADPEGYKRTIELLKAADEQLARSAYFKNTGSGASGGGSAEAQLQAKAEQLIQKDSKFTKEQAFAKACEDNPALVRQYRAEQQ